MIETSRDLHWLICKDKKGKVYYQCPMCDAVFPSEVGDYCHRCGEELVMPKNETEEVQND